MRQIFFPAVVAGSALLLIGLVSLNVVISAYNSCVYINFNRPDRNVILFGRVERVREQNGWIMTRLRLCGSGLTGAAAIEVLTPVKAGWVDIGEEAQYLDQPVFHWVKQNMNVFRQFVVPGRFLALRPEEIKSEAALMEQYNQRSEDSCQSIPICRSRLEFYRRHGPQSTVFLSHLKEKNFLGLTVDLALGRAVVFSEQFDRVPSLIDFQRLSEKLTL
jgi:hypothetical protein